jgi:type IV pilus assembly protein PilV
MLLEALISIAIFSIGVLGLIGLQAAAIKNADDARQRAVAAFYGNQLISRMWADDHDPANLAELCAPAPRDDVRPPFRRPLCRRGIGQCERHQLACHALRTELNGLTSAAIASSLQQITVDPATNIVTVTLCWKNPEEAVYHSYTTAAQIRG